MPAMGVLIERLAISALFLYYSKNIDLPVVCKKLSCPQGNSRRGALIGDGADGCSVYARCDSARSSVTREKDMMDGQYLNDGRPLRPPHVVDVERERQRRRWLVTLMYMHACKDAWRMTGYVR